MVRSGLAPDHGLAVSFPTTAVELTVNLPAVELAASLTVEGPRGVTTGSVSERINIS